uniref:Cation-transporting ATPase n=1 Tax=Blastobotrys adeninivorans TaxID=409370 RepID=A0A060TCR2_BLAAD
MSDDRVTRFNRAPSFRRSESIASQFSQSGNFGHYAENASDQIFAGPVSESIPSSYSAFHHRRYSRSSSRAPHKRRQSSEVEQDLSASFSSQRRPSFASSVASGVHESRSNFRFFTQQEVTDADGTSTVAYDMDPVDYERYRELQDDSESGEYTPSIYDNPHQHPSRYGYEGDDSVEYYHSTEEPQATRPRRRSSAYDDVVSSEEPLLEPSYSNEQINVYPSIRRQQRFYISEEDIVIVIAAYKNSYIRSIFYYLLCVGTFGLAFLILRWFPRLRVSCVGKPCPMGECDWVVIEDQWGQLAIETVDAKRYNRSMSTVFRLADEKHEQPATVEHDLGSPLGDGINDEDEYIDPDPPIPTLRFFEYRYIRFFYHPGEDFFRTNLDWVDPGWLNGSVQEGIESDDYHDRQTVFGPNAINIREKTTLQLLVDEVLHPFYVFQIFSIILWACDEYYYYAGCIFLISLFSVGNALIETKRTLHRLRELSRFECEVRVYRNGFWTTISSEDLVPGDVYELSDPSLSFLPCDSLLLSGDCIVNESMLTGESVPVSKIPANEDAYHHLVYPEKSQGSNVSPRVVRSYLYSGTKIISVKRPLRDGVEADDNIDEDSLGVSLAMVVRTGFGTTKGALVRSMLFPKPSGFKFYRDSFKYIGVMAVIAAVGFLVSAYSFIKMHLETRLIILRALDLITIVVPPALPATLTIGTNISLARLRKKSIFCISPNRVNVGGKLDIVCFDKTGTLTEDGLDVLGVRLIQDHYCQFSGMYKDLIHHEEETSDHAMLYTLATCHELRTVDGELIGDPLDLKMFEFTGWTFQEVGLGGRISRSPDGIVLETIKQFEFESKLRRMSVLVKQRGSPGVSVFVKGAPEVMAEICDPETLPEDYWSQLEYYTHRGYRVIACASKPYDGTKLGADREEVERGLKLIGFIIFENRLKPTTSSAIRKLGRANIRTVMCTGDNVLTAISVGKECYMLKADSPVFVPHFDENMTSLRWECIDDPELVLDSELMTPVPRLDDDDYSLAVTGDAFRYILQYGSEYQVEQMLLRGAIFARMSPDEKHELVEKLQELDYTTCFCGDGANDCGALKAADVGVSLSEAEASVAAPFTSSKFEISCVLDVIKEGRCALSTSFSCFKYMSMYSAIQFVSVTILYSLGSNLGDFQFLWIDLFLILPIAIFMAWAKPFDVLSIKRPTASLTSRKVLVPLLGQITIFAVFQLIVWYAVKLQSWYEPPIRGGSDDEVVSSDNSSLFVASCLQYIFIAIVLSVGPPYRQPMYKNLPFVGTVIVCTVCTLGILLVDENSQFGQLMQLSYLSTVFKVGLVFLMALNFVVSLSYESAMAPILIKALMGIKRLFGVGKMHSNKRYKVLLQENFTV